MRIISGKYGGRRISPPNKMPHTRPTTDIAKEGLFNILQNNLDFSVLKTLDLFGGTGCISYELASRGAIDLTIVEKDIIIYEFIKKNKMNFGIENMQVIKQEVFSFIQNTKEQYDFIFAGPPYALTAIDELPLQIFKKQLLQKNGWFVLEHTPRNDYKKFENYKMERNYGTTIFSIFIQD